jgi:hypothetical protein
MISCSVKDFVESRGNTTSGMALPFYGLGSFAVLGSATGRRTRRAGGGEDTTAGAWALRAV